MAAILIALGLYFALNRQPEPLPPTGPRLPVWSIDPESLTGLAIELPADGEGQTWLRDDEGNWHFNSRQGRRVDDRRWGGGIPLLLSGPSAERLIAEDATGEQLLAFGLLTPKMTIALTLADGQRVRIDVGDATPGGSATYVRLAKSRSVYSVHHSFREVLERLVRDPPYLEPAVN
jgi:hypothetical protein